MYYRGFREMTTKHVNSLIKKAMDEAGSCDQPKHYRWGHSWVTSDKGTERVIFELTINTPENITGNYHDFRNPGNIYHDTKKLSRLDCGVEYPNNIFFPYSANFSLSSNPNKPLLGNVISAGLGDDTGMYVTNWWGILVELSGNTFLSSKFDRIYLSEGVITDPEYKYMNIEYVYHTLSGSSPYHTITEEIYTDNFGVDDSYYYKNIHGIYCKFMISEHNAFNPSDYDNIGG